MKLLPNIKFQRGLFTFLCHDHKFLVITVASLLSACGAVAVVEDAPLDEGRFRLQYYHGITINYAQIERSMERKASEICPQGWLNTDVFFERGILGARKWFWEILCIDTELTNLRELTTNRSMEHLCEASMIIRGSVHSTGPRDENTSYVKFDIAKVDSTVDDGNMLTLYGVGDTPFELGEEYIIFKMYDWDDYWAFKDSKVSYRLFKIIKIDDVIAVTNGYPIADLKTAIIDDHGVKKYDALPSLPFNPMYAKLSDFITVVADYCKHDVK